MQMTTYRTAHRITCLLWLMGSQQQTTIGSEAGSQRTLKSGIEGSMTPSYPSLIILFLSIRLLYFNNSHSDNPKTFLRLPKT